MADEKSVPTVNDEIHEVGKAEHHGLSVQDINLKKNIHAKWVQPITTNNR